MKSGIPTSQLFLKRTFDIVTSSVGLLLSWWVIIFAWMVASFETRSNGFFVQKRIGKDGRDFRVIKIKTMAHRQEYNSTITTVDDARITKSGMFFRRTKIDELPQLWNVLLGDMSVVGPRPDVPGYADRLQGDDRLVLSVRPGITGPATLKYRDEETLLSMQDDPAEYNDQVIFPDKVKINREYVQHYSFLKDLNYIWKTVLG